LRIKEGKMKKLHMIIPLVILLCFAAEYSNAQDYFQQKLKFTLTLQTGEELVPGIFILLTYERPKSVSVGTNRKVSVEIHYYVEVNAVEIHRVINLHKVESIEFIANEEDKSSIEQVKIDLWDGSKVIYKKVSDANDSIEEISTDGEKKTFKSAGFFCIKKEEKPWYLDIIQAAVGGKEFRDHYYTIKRIKFHK